MKKFEIKFSFSKSCDQIFENITITRFVSFKSDYDNFSKIDFARKSER
jgi:hypothetical protein